jgi:DNA invertase Pin-like site-specific DNA recombinase
VSEIGKDGMTKPNEGLFVAYYRVSTDRQGDSGLGLEAQRSSVARFTHGASLLSEFQEIESGKNHTNRPQLTAALAMCRVNRATLVIAKLDRLARDVHFISGLMKAGVDFIAVDMPQANKLTVHILAAVAEHEREAISQRTKAALQIAKARGTQLGNPRWQDSIERARAARNPTPVPPAIVAAIVERRAQGLPLRKIAEQLNGMGVRTPRGHRWHPETISNVLSR